MHKNVDISITAKNSKYPSEEKDFFLVQHNHNLQNVRVLPAVNFLWPANVFMGKCFLRYRYFSCSFMERLGNTDVESHIY
jgi:hypothetical protein